MSIELIIFFSIQRSWYPQQKSYWGWRYHEHLLLSIKFHLCLFIRNLWKTCRILWHFYLQQLVSVFMFWTDGLGEEGSDHKNAQGAFVCQINRVLSFYPIFIKFALLKKKKKGTKIFYFENCICKTILWTSEWRKAIMLMLMNLRSVFLK